MFVFNYIVIFLFNFVFVCAMNNENEEKKFHEIFKKFRTQKMNLLLKEINIIYHTKLRILDFLYPNDNKEKIEIYKNIQLYHLKKILSFLFIPLEDITPYNNFYNRLNKFNIFFDLLRYVKGIEYDSLFLLSKKTILNEYNRDKNYALLEDIKPHTYFLNSNLKDIILNPYEYFFNSNLTDIILNRRNTNGILLYRFNIHQKINNYSYTIQDTGYNDEIIHWKNFFPQLNDSTIYTWSLVMLLSDLQKQSEQCVKDYKEVNTNFKNNMLKNNIDINNNVLVGGNNNQCYVFINTQIDNFINNISKNINCENRAEFNQKLQELLSPISNHFLLSYKKLHIGVSLIITLLLIYISVYYFRDVLKSFFKKNAFKNNSIYSNQGYKIFKNK